MTLSDVAELTLLSWDTVNLTSSRLKEKPNKTEVFSVPSGYNATALAGTRTAVPSPVSVAARSGS